MTQHTQPVVAQQQQLQTAGVQTTTTTPTITTQSNNNNHNSSNASNSNNTSNNQTTQTVSIQQPQMNNNNNNNTSNNNNYSNQTQTAATANIYNPTLPSTNLYMSATAAASHGMSAHAQHGTMYPAMIPAPLSSNVFVNNVTANVNLHGWAHTVPTGAWVHPSASHYIHGDVPTEQGTPVMQSMPMSIPLTSANTMSGPVVGGNPNLSGISGGSRGSRRGQGRRGGGSSRRNDYNSQRHPPPAGSPAPQQAALTNNQTQDYSPQQQQGQQQSSIDTQQLMSGAPPAYVAHPPYGGHQPQYQCAYPAFFAPQNPMMHAGQSTAVQQATGTPLYFSTMPFYNGAHVYNYGYILPPVMSPADYQYVPGEDVVGGPGEERQACPGEGGAMMWHQQPIYAEDYAMNPGDMHVSAGAGDDMNHTASSMGSAAETPSMLSPNYGPIYDAQLHEMQQQLGVMQIYDDPQLGQMQAMHPVVGSVQQMDEELSECAANGVAPTGAIQIVPAGAIIASGSMPITSDGQMMHQHHQPQQQTSHPQQPNQLISAGQPMLPIEPSTPTAPLQQPSHFAAAVPETIDGGNAPNEFNNYMHAAESISSLCESATTVQQSSENLANDYQQHYNIAAQQQQQQLIQQPQHHQHHHQQHAETTTNDIYSNELQDNATNNNGLRSDAIEVTIATSLVKNHPQSLGYIHQQQLQTESRFKSTSTTQQTQTVGSIQTITQAPYQQQPQTQPQPQQQQQQQQPQQQQQQQQQHQQATHYQVALTPSATPSQQQHQTGHYHATTTAPASASSSSSSSSYHTTQHAYETRKQSQSYNQQQTRRKHDYQQHHGSSNSNNETVATQPTKTMSWTNSSQHKKSTNTVAVTATPSNSNEGRYNKQSVTGSGATSTNSSYGHGSRTYTNQQHHNYHQQQQQYTQQPQARSYGAMKMPSSPISSTSTHSNPIDRKNSQASETGKQTTTTIATVPSTSTASTTVTPLQFQQSTTQQVALSSMGSSSGNESAVSNKQYPPGFANKKLIMQQTLNSTITSTTASVTTTTTTTTATANATGADVNPQPIINLAPPASTVAPSNNPSALSWAGLFSDSNKSPSLPFNNTIISNLPSATTSTSQNFGNTASPALPPPFSKKPIAKVAPYEGNSPAVPASPAVTPGAMSYSAASAQGLSQISSNKKSSDTQSQRHNLANLDEFTVKFAEFLTKYKSDLTAVSLRPRGLTNRSNYCYINSILQALLGCAPFYNLIRSIPKQAAALCEVKTPTVNAMITFMSNFSNLPTGLRLRTTKGPKNKDDLSGELQCDPAFEPTEIYKLWNDSREEHVEGRQEDAEEFLSYILNKLNDEMLEILKLIAKPNSEQNGQNEQSENEDGDVWQMIRNNRNKGSVTRQTDFGHTPLSDIFRGELRSRLQREGEHSTDVIQPFFTLQLNIEKAASVKEALEILVGRDQLEGVTGSKTKQEVVAWQQMTLEKLPIVLILHLKWFDYRSDGCTKILKKVEFPVELKIDAKILASKKYSQKQRAYRLFAVVYHDGKEASKGHYITDVYHTGYGSWLRYDDSSVKPVSENHVLVPRTPRVPYLLYYRRCDTLPPQINTSSTSSSSNSSSNNNSNTSGNAAMTSFSGK